MVPAAVLAAPTPTDDDAMKDLLLLGARSHGVGHGPLPRPTTTASTSSRRAGSWPSSWPTARCARSTVEGWKQPAFLHPEAELPRWVRASALLSPFDSLVWERQRTERLFDFRYRIEIYVPAAQRVHGYYVLPFLNDGRLVARVDLKADRQAGTLLRARRLRRADLGRRPGPRPPSSSASRSWPRSSGLASRHRRARQGDLAPQRLRRLRGRRPRVADGVPHEPGEDVAAVGRCTTSVCSNWAVRRRSTVTAVQPSSHRSCSHAPIVIIGSMVKVMPSSIDAVEARLVVVGHVQVGVELLADPVADEAAHHAEAVALGMLLDGPADLVEGSARAHDRDGALEALAGDLDEAAALVVDVADQEGGVGVAVDAVEVDRDVEVADVAVDQRAVVGDAVADHLVDRGAQRLREAVVVERARVAPALDARLVADRVELVGGDPRTDGGAGEREHLAGGAPGAPHALDDIGALHRAPRVGAPARPDSA